MLAALVRESKEAKRSGRPQIRWRDAATKYIEDNMDASGNPLKSSLSDQAAFLEQLDPFIGDLFLEQVHDDTLKPYVAYRRTQGRKSKTINIALGVVRHILNLASSSWRHKESGKTWIEHAPKITMVKPSRGLSDARRPYPLDWEEQERLLKHLPAHLARMVLFKVNTGCREDEVCSLRWEWEWQTQIPELKGRVFIIPGNAMLLGSSSVKNREDRLIVCNDTAKSVIDSCRGDHPSYVFSLRGSPVKSMNNTAWKRAWKKAGLPMNMTYRRGVHNLKNTFGRRLRALGVAFETRQVLLGHKNGSVTTHYCQAEIQELLDAVQLLCIRKSRKTPALVLLKLNTMQASVA